MAGCRAWGRIWMGGIWLVVRVFRGGIWVV